MVKKKRKQPFTAYQARVSYQGRIVETGGPYKYKKSALEEAIEIRKLFKGQKGYRASAAKTIYSGYMKKPSH